MGPRTEDEREAVHPGIVLDLGDAPVHDRRHLARLYPVLGETIALGDDGDRPAS